MGRGSGGGSGFLGGVGSGCFCEGRRCSCDEGIAGGGNSWRRKRASEYGKETDTVRKRGVKYGQRVASGNARRKNARERVWSGST
eukprot:5012079-Pleurochrysis_carterae.AAC.1